MSLHSFWDNVMMKSKKFRSVRNEATTLRNKPDLSRDKLANELGVKSFNDWAVGTYKVAIAKAYFNGTLQGSNDKKDGVPLPNDYMDKAKEMAERQIVLSGYRISEAMVEVFGK